MQYREFTNGAGTTYKRINKTQARNTFERGELIVMCPVNLHPFGLWTCGISVTKRNEYDTFERYENMVTAYNCINSETGTYLAYYVQA